MYTNGVEGSQFEQVPKARFVPPAVESFQNPEQAAEVWPEVILENSTFQEHVAAQKEALASLETILARIPIGVTIRESLAIGELTEEEAIPFFTSLAGFIESDGGHERLVLYLPFELLDLDLEVASSELTYAFTDFKHAYHTAWSNQLHSHEVRANFTDGDILEEELRDGDFDRVVKAAHLIPSLVEKKFLTIDQVINIGETSFDHLLIDGVVEALLVLKDKGLLTEDHLAALKDSSQYIFRDAYRQLSKDEIAYSETPSSLELSPTTILRQLQETLVTIETYDPGKSTPARTTWLRSEAKKKALGEASTALAHQLLVGAFPLNELFEIKNETSTVACIDALRIAASSEPSLYAEYEPWLAEIHDVPPDVSDAITKLYAHLYAQNILSKEVLNEHDIKIPSLSGPFSENLKGSETLLTELEEMTKSIEEHPYLSKYVYPVSLMFGSQLKGYGLKSADADIAVFIKPHTPREEKEMIEAQLATLFDHEKIGGHAGLFWLDEIDTAGNLKVHDWEHPTASDAESTWTHVLFGASWHGDKKSIGELHKKLLTNYFYKPDTMTKGKPTRERWLEELERDTLQYRLMHKGYQRYYPIHTQKTTHSAAIDGDSVFWDEGYRRTATKLFVSRVFIPNLGKKP